jgi:hypothetical protein
MFSEYSTTRDERTLFQWDRIAYPNNIRTSIQPIGVGPVEVSVYCSRIVVHVQTEDTGSHPGILLHNRTEFALSGKPQPTYAEKWAYHEN